jgi:hypothetical protein
VAEDNLGTYFDQCEGMLLSVCDFLFLTPSFSYPKYWDELSIWNSDFTSHIPKAKVDELQELEMALLKLLLFEMTIPGNVYVKQ